MANILSDQYKSVFSKPKHNVLELTFKETTCPNLNNINPTISDFLDARICKEPKSTTPENITAHIHADYAEELVEPMKIWRPSLETGKIPEGTRLALINPIYKGGDESTLAKYRPVALTNHLIKIFERVLRLDSIAPSITQPNESNAAWLQIQKVNH